jgi:hypothetical protein
MSPKTSYPSTTSKPQQGQDSRYTPHPSPPAGRSSATSTRTATKIKLPAVYPRFSTTTRSPRTNAYNLLPWLQEEEPPQPLSESLPPIRRGAGALEANCNSWWLTYVKGQTDKLMAHVLAVLTWEGFNDSPHSYLCSVPKRAVSDICIVFTL